MALTGRSKALGIAAMCIVAAVWYLRDPPWLLSYSSGFHPWEAGGDGRPYRWTKGHASFFVPSDARRITLPLRSLNESPEDWPITATVTIDDRVADQVTFRNDAWHELSIRMPDTMTRRVRRIDIRLDRVRSRLRGVQLGPVELQR